MLQIVKLNNQEPKLMTLSKKQKTKKLKTEQKYRKKSTVIVQKTVLSPTSWFSAKLRTFSHKEIKFAKKVVCH